jgi:hypothetical protein
VSPLSKVQKPALKNSFPHRTRRVQTLLLAL